MEIYINGEKVSYTLQNEKTFNDVLEFILSFLDKNDLYIDKISINNQSYDFEEVEKFKSYSIEQIDKVDIKAAFKQELVSETVENIISYLTNVVSYFKENENYTEENLNKIKDGLIWCINVVDKILVIYSVSVEYFLTKSEKQFSFVCQQLKEIAENLHLISSNKEFKQQLLETIVDFMDGMIKIVTYVFVRLKNLPKETKKEHFITLFEDNIKLLSKIKELFISIANNFKEGKEKTAMELFSSSINFLAFYFEVLILCTDSFSDSDYNFSEIHDSIKSFSEIFSNIKTSIAEKDYVNLSDILEYEINEPINKLIIQTNNLVDYLKNYKIENNSKSN
ncbi:MAG: hypothetical protein GYA61_07645 [Spirochaetales bacterium]|nr:hypothetical protein [Spirochaetales bacterium]